MSELTEKLGITPGPWSTNLNDYHDLCIYDVKGKWITNVAEKKEDAQLMAASPEMLEALIKQELSHDKCNAVSESIVKIIEKATGKTWQEIKQLIGE